MDNNIKKYAQTMIKNELFSVIFPEKMEERTEENVRRIAEQIDSAAGIAVFEDDNKNNYYGILIDKVKQAKKIINQQGNSNDSQL